MSLWSRISDAVSALRSGESLSEVFARLRTPPEKSVAFAIAVIALGAKMAKADGTVTRDEVAAFREVFSIPPSEEAAAARVFNLARQDIAGFDLYARRIAAMFKPGAEVLEDLIEGLFFIANADGAYHPAEDSFIRDVAEIFGIGEGRFRSMRMMYAPHAEPDCYAVLGVDFDAPMDEIRSAWRRMVRDTHPDRMIARGVPEEAVALATRKLALINRAWDKIQAERA
jgi:DnaJ like chaperone protein